MLSSLRPASNNSCTRFAQCPLDDVPHDESPATGQGVDET